MPTRSTAAARILIVDDEALIRDTLAEFLTQEGFTVEAVASGETALERAAAERFDIAICDVQLPGIDGIQVLERLLKISPQTFVLLVTAYATVENAVEAFQRGAHDYLMKPILLDEVLGKVRRMLRYRDLYQENQDLRRELNRQGEPPPIVGRSLVMQRVFELIRRVAPTRSTVLIVGESGTGKELVARAIHRQGPEPDARFVPVNCAAIPHDLLENQLFGHRKGAFTGADRDQPGIFVHAGAGTVFLDEIAELSLATQAKLLRAIEQKEVLPVGAAEPVPVAARVLAATNKDLKKEMESGRFREDLYYRLNVVTMRTAAAARSPGRHSGSRGVPDCPPCPGSGQADHGRRSRRHASAAGVSVARERARTRQRPATRGDPRRRAAPEPGRFAAGSRPDRKRSIRSRRTRRSGAPVRTTSHRADSETIAGQARSRPAAGHGPEFAVSADRRTGDCRDIGFDRRYPPVIGNCVR